MRSIESADELAAKCIAFRRSPHIEQVAELIRADRRAVARAVIARLEDVLQIFVTWDEALDAVDAEVAAGKFDGADDG